MSLKRAPIVFLNFSETESDFNVVNNAEETEDNDYYKFVESEYDKLQVEHEPDDPPEPKTEPKPELEHKPEPKKPVPEETPKKKRGRPKGSLNKKKKGDLPILPNLPPGVALIPGSSMPIPPEKKKRGRKKKILVEEVKKPGKKKKKKREKKAYHFCDDDDDNDIGLEGEISDDEYIRRLEEQVHKENSEAGSRSEFGNDYDSSSQGHDSGDENPHDDDASTLEDQFTVCDEDIISYRSEGSEIAETFIQNINSRLSAYADLDNEIMKNGPQLELPPSSTDLRCQNDCLMDACATYEVLRRYGRILRLSPFRFEDFLTALTVRENSVLLSEVHMCLLKAALREDDASATWINLQDQKDSVNLSFYLNDFMSWPQLLREYVNSISPENDPSSALCHLEICNRYPFVDFRIRLRVLQHLTDQFLASSAVREEIIRENVIRYEDYCRICHKMGDLLCCDLCPAVFHLDCLNPPMSQVPRDEWHCPVCTQQQVSGVTDVVSEGERRGVMHRHAPLGVDRHGRQYWFIARRLFVDAPTIDSDGCVSTDSGSTLWYYSCKEKYNQVLNSLSPEYEPALLEAMKELKTEVFRQMEITRRLTEEKFLTIRERPNGPSSAELLDEIAACERLQREHQAASAAQDGEAATPSADNPSTDRPTVEGAASDMVVDQETGEKLTVANDNGASGYVTRSRTGNLTSREDNDYLVDRNGNLPSTEDELRDFLKKQDAQGEAKRSGVFDLGERLVIITKDGQKYQLRKGRASTSDKHSYEDSLTGGFRLSDEGDWRNWKNVYSSNQQEASSKQQFQEERDRRRFLSYKFSLTDSSTMVWKGDTNGSPSALLNSLRLTICHLETQLPSSLLCPRWREERKNWYVDLHRCVTARQLIACLAKLEACIRSVCLVNAWRDAIGHLTLERITAVSREEKKRAKQAERKMAKLKAQEQSQNDVEDDSSEEIEPVAVQTVYTKNPGQIKHRIWKMPGEEYRIVAGGGWFWCAKGWEKRPKARNTLSLRSLARYRREALLESQKFFDEDAPLGWGVLGDSAAGQVVTFPHRGSRFVLSDCEVVDLDSGITQKTPNIYPDLTKEKPSSHLDGLLSLREAMEDETKDDSDEAISPESKENKEMEALSAEQKDLEELEILKKKREDIIANQEQLRILLAKETALVTTEPSSSARRGVQRGMKRGPYRKRRPPPSEDSLSFVSNTPKPTPHHSEAPTPASSVKRSSYYAANDTEEDEEMEPPQPRDKEGDYLPSSDEDGEDFLLPQVDGVVDSDPPPAAQVATAPGQHVQLVSQASGQATTPAKPPLFMVKTASGQVVSLQMRSGVSSTSTAISTPNNTTTTATTATTAATPSGLRILRLPGGLTNPQTVIAKAPATGNRTVATPLSGSLVVKKVAGRSSVGGAEDSAVIQSEAAAKVAASSPSKPPISLPTSGVQTIKVVPGSLNQLSSLGNMRLVVRSTASSVTNPGASLIKTSPPTGATPISNIRTLATTTIAQTAAGQKTPMTALSLDQLRALQQRRLQEHNVDLDSDEEGNGGKKVAVVAGVNRAKTASLATQLNAKLQAITTNSLSKSVVASRAVLPQTSTAQLTPGVKQIAANVGGQTKKPHFIRIAVVPGSGSSSGRQLVASAVNSSTGQPLIIQQLPSRLVTSSSQLNTSTSTTASMNSTLQGGRRSLAKQQLSSMVPIPNATPSVMRSGNSLANSRAKVFQTRKEPGVPGLAIPGLGYGDSIRVRMARLEVDLINLDEKIAALEDKITSRKRSTKDPVSIKRLRPSVTRATLSSFKMPRSNSLPLVCDFITGGSSTVAITKKNKRLHNLFRLDRERLRALISKAGRMEVPGFHYEKKTAFMHWPYPGPRPSLSYGWRYRLQTADSLFGVALQLRLIWHCLKWDDINSAPESFGIFKETKDGTTFFRRVLDIRYLDMHGLKCELNVEIRTSKQVKNGLREKTRSIDSDDDEEANEDDSDPDFKPRSATRRRRKRRSVRRMFDDEEDSNQDQTETTVTNSWIVDSSVELWELRYYVETNQRLITTALRSVPADNLALNSRIMSTPALSNIVLDQRLAMRSSVVKDDKAQPTVIHGVAAARRKLNFGHLMTREARERGAIKEDEAMLAESSERGTPRTSRPRRSNAGMKMRQWQDDSEMANMLAAYDGGGGGVLPEGRSIRPSVTSRGAFSSERASIVTPSSAASESRQVLVPYWRQSDAARSVTPRRPLRPPQSPRADMAALRQQRQQLARIRKQICKRSRDLRASILERRKLIESDIQLQIEEEIHFLKEKQANELLERKAERKRKHHEKKMRKEMKRRAREGLTMPAAPVGTPKPRGRPPKAESGRPMGRPPVNNADTLGSSRKRSSQHLLLESPEVKLEPDDGLGPAAADGRPFSAALPSSPKKARRSFMPESATPVKKQVSAGTPRKRLSSDGPKPLVPKRKPGRPRKVAEEPQTPVVKKRGRRKSEKTETDTSFEAKTEAKTELKEEEVEDGELYCICKTPYDAAKFYIGCDLCEGWFHGACVNMSPKSARRVASWICPQCTSLQETTQEELYCLCRTPYDETKFYVACDSCNDWFHGACVGLSEEEAADIDSYVCPTCINEHKNKRGKVKTLYDRRIKGAKKAALISLIAELKQNSMAWPFLEPIDTTEEPNYLRIVKTPMDLRTAESNLVKGKYKNIGDFVADIHLIFNNCRRYNPKDTPHFRCADVLETLFVKRMKAIQSASD